MTRVFVAAATHICETRRVFAYYLHNLDPIIFRIYDNVGPRWYGLAYVLAFVSSYLLFLWLAKRGYADLSPQRDRKSTRLNSSHSQISYAVFCLKKKKEMLY